MIVKRTGTQKVRELYPGPTWDVQVLHSFTVITLPGQDSLCEQNSDLSFSRILEIILNLFRILSDINVGGKNLLKSVSDQPKLHDL